MYVTGLGAAASGFVPYAGQMTLSGDQDWVAQVGVPNDIYWPVWDRLTTVIAPAFNPDGMASLTTAVPAAVSNFRPPGPTFPGFTIPVDGVYFVQSSLQFTSSLVGPLADNPSVVVVAWNPSGLSPTQRVDRNWQGTLGNNGTTDVAYTLDASGMMNLTAGQVLFTFMDTRNNLGGANYVVAGFSFFGVHRVR